MSRLLRLLAGKADAAPRSGASNVVCRIEEWTVVGDPGDEQREPDAVPCPVCRSAHRKVLPGAICFSCEKSAEREAQNDMPLVTAYLGRHAAFHDWCVEHGRDEEAA